MRKRYRKVMGSIPIGGLDKRPQNGMAILEMLALIFGTISGIANFPQAYKIFKRKSAKDISMLTYSFLFIGATVWILYGIELWNLPIIITNTAGAINIGLVIIGWLLYGRDK